MRFLCTDEAAAINGARIPLDGEGESRRCEPASSPA